MPDSLEGRRFTSLERLGQGAMGEVFLAQDGQQKRQVALKRLAAPFRNDEGWQRHLEFQASALQRVSNPHIVGIFELARQGGDVYLVMEYVDGFTLRERLRDPISIAEVLRIAVECTDALAAAHTVGIVHQDVKPENIMLTRKDRVVKLCDFGVARRMADTARESDGSRTAGLPYGATTRYAAPEIVRGDEIDGRADIFSLGVVLYEALASHHPFPGSFTWPTVDAPPAAPLRRVNAQVPEELESIVDRMLQKRPADRFSSAAELLKALWSLQHAIGDEDSEATRPFVTPDSPVRPTAPAPDLPVRGNAAHARGQSVVRGLGTMAMAAAVSLIASLIALVWAEIGLGWTFTPNEMAIIILAFLSMTIVGVRLRSRRSLKHGNPRH
jgi:serine/threonine-protein kinase